MITEQGRWAGRNPDKDVIRHEIWSGLERDGVAVGPAWSMIPNFVGADVDAWHLAQTDAWKAAKTVKTNPDAPQIPIRIRALYEGKLVFAPVPYLTQDFPYLRLDPERLQKNGVSFELAATSQGFIEHGERIGFEDVAPLDFCVVGLGCGHATGRPHRQGRRLRRSRNRDLSRTRHRQRHDTDRHHSAFQPACRR